MPASHLPPAPTFDLSAGSACLDFANTQGVSGDDLHSYADLLAFASQAHLITPTLAIQLHTNAQRAASDAQAAFVHGLHLRATLRAIFTAVADQQHPLAYDLET